MLGHFLTLHLFAHWPSDVSLASSDVFLAQKKQNLKSLAQ